MKLLSNELIKTNFDFGWKKWDNPPYYANLTIIHQRGDVLDIGCATCEVYKFLHENGWRKKYYGIDMEKYEDYEYPDNVNLIIGNALELEFPEVDTVILYNILEHVEDPLSLLKKSIEKCRKNVLINIPKRNEEMWKYGFSEIHQLDKTHKHCGFSKKEVFNLVELGGGKIKIYKDVGKINAMIGIHLWNNPIPLKIVHYLNKIFPSKAFYDSIWCEVVKNEL